MCTLGFPDTYPGCSAHTRVATRVYTLRVYTLLNTPLKYTRRVFRRVVILLRYPGTYPAGCFGRSGAYVPGYHPGTLVGLVPGYPTWLFCSYSGKYPSIYPESIYIPFWTHTWNMRGVCSPGICTMGYPNTYPAGCFGRTGIVSRVRNLFLIVVG